MIKCVKIINSQKEGRLMQQFITQLDQLIGATAWEMETPKAYSLFHILFVVVGFSLCAILAWKLRNVSEKGNRVILLSVGIFLLISEIYKQLFYCFYLSNNTYVWWIFPFQLCSVPMYLCLLAPLLKPGKIQKGMYSFMMVYNLLGGAIAFAEPSGLFHPYWTLTAHALVWHMMIVFVGLYLIFSGRGGRSISDYWSATRTFLALCAIAFIINLVFRDVSDGTINMFFIGPSNSSLVVFKQIAEYFGWYVSTALYIPAVCFGAYLCFLPVYLSNRNKEKSVL